MKRKLSIFAIIVGIALIFIGISSLIVGCDGGFSGGAYVPSYLYDHGYATFGSDYYTYTNNNMARIAENSDIIADNLNDIGEYLFIFIGLITICFGLIVVCGFGIVLAGCPKNELAEDTSSNEVPVEDTPIEEASAE